LLATGEAAAGVTASVQNVTICVSRGAWSDYSFFVN